MADFTDYSGFSPAVVGFLGPAQAAESGPITGDNSGITAQNPNSSASGPFQYTDGTWQDVVNKYGPKYGFTMAGKNDPAQQRYATAVLAQNEYLPFWQSMGVPAQNVTPSDLYQLHVFGQPAVQAMYNAGPEAPLSKALGSRFAGVYGANKALFGNNPNLTVGDAYRAVDQHFLNSKGGISMPGVTNNVPQLPATPAQDPNAAPAQPVPPTFNPNSPQSLQNAQPGNTGFFSPTNLLRMAAGLAGGQTFGQSIAGAANNLAQGQEQDQQMALQRGQQALQQGQLGVQQGQLALQKTQANHEALSAAMPLIQMGMAPQTALGLANGTITGQAAQQALANFKSNGGQSSAGEVFYTPDGHVVQQENHPYGAPTYIDGTTGKPLDTLPAGSMRPQDKYFQTLSGDDAKALSGDLNTASNAGQQISDLTDLQGLLPSIQSGTGIFAQFQHHVANMLGGDTATAQQEANQVMAQLKTDRVALLGDSHIGRMDIPIVKALQSAGPNWQDSPQALQAITNYSIAGLKYQQGMVDAWNGLDPTQQAGGYRRWKIAYQQQNPFSDYAARYLAANSNLPAAGSGAYGAANAAAAGGQSPAIPAPTGTPSGATPAAGLSLGGGVPRPMSQADYAAIPSGTPFINPADGKTYIKQ